ncbi:MAG TPA: hypothetical protein VHD33_07190, partial [Legionellaceae bacterium]|nr:hypothetical protein [Legionellaceae bacterium]
DNDLYNNPSAYINSVERQDLYVSIDDDLFEDIPFDDNPLAMVIPKTNGINLTALLQKAGISNKEKIELAKQDKHIALGFVANNDLYDAFSRQQQMHLLLILLSQHQIEVDRVQVKLNILFTINSIKKVEIFEVCENEPELVQYFFETYPEYLAKLDFDTLYALRNTLKAAAVLLVNAHAEKLDPITLRELSKKYDLKSKVPLDADKIALIDAFKQACLRDTLKWALACSIMKICGVQTWQYCKNARQRLLLIQAIIEIDKTFDYFKAEMPASQEALPSVTVQDDASTVLDPSMSVPAQNTIRPFSASDIDFLVDEVTALSSDDLTYNLLNNTHFFEKILMRARISQIIRFFLALPTFETYPHASFYVALLQSIPNGKDALIEVLNRICEDIGFATKNSKLFEILLSDPYYLQEMEEGKSPFRQRVARLIGRYEIKVDTTNLSSYPVTVQCIEAYQIFFAQYIRSKTKITQTHFAPLFEKTHFFLELFHIETDDCRVLFDILRAAQSFDFSNRALASDFFYTI